MLNMYGYIGVAGLLVSISPASTALAAPRAGDLNCGKFNLQGVYNNFNGDAQSVGKIIGIFGGQLTDTNSNVGYYTVSSLNASTDSSGFTTYTSKGIVGHIISAVYDYGPNEAPHCALTWFSDAPNSYTGWSTEATWCIIGQDSSGNILLADENDGCVSHAHTLNAIGRVTYK